MENGQAHDKVRAVRERRCDCGQKIWERDRAHITILCHRCKRLHRVPISSLLTNAALDCILQVDKKATG